MTVTPTQESIVKKEVLKKSEKGQSGNLFGILFSYMGRWNEFWLATESDEENQQITDKIEIDSQMTCPLELQKSRRVARSSILISPQLSYFLRNVNRHVILR